jgi:hypothetical protein
MTEFSNPVQTQTKTERSPGKKAYVSPQLREYGDLRHLTLGASPGAGDSFLPAERDEDTGGVG